MEEEEDIYLAQILDNDSNNRTIEHLIQSQVATKSLKLIITNNLFKAIIIWIR